MIKYKAMGRLMRREIGRVLGPQNIYEKYLKRTTENRLRLWTKISCNRQCAFISRDLPPEASTIQRTIIRNPLVEADIEDEMESPS